MPGRRVRKPRLGEETAWVRHLGLAERGCSLGQRSAGRVMGPPHRQPCRETSCLGSTKAPATQAARTLTVTASRVPSWVSLPTVRRSVPSMTDSVTLNCFMQVYLFIYVPASACEPLGSTKPTLSTHPFWVVSLTFSEKLGSLRADPGTQFTPGNSCWWSPDAPRTPRLVCRRTQ